MYGRCVGAELGQLVYSYCLACVHCMYTTCSSTKHINEQHSPHIAVRLIYSEHKCHTKLESYRQIGDYVIKSESLGKYDLKFHLEGQVIV